MPAKSPALLGHDRSVERGRFLVEEFGCARCHVPAPGDKIGAGLDSREGPNLAQVGKRFKALWIYHWLKDPQAYSTTATMPNFKLNDDDARDISAFLISSSTPASLKIVTASLDEAKKVSADFGGAGD